MNYPSMRFPGGRCKALTLSYDDSVVQDIRLIRLLTRYGVKGTFNVNSGKLVPEGTVYPEGEVHRMLTWRQSAEIYNNPLVEVASHGLTHPFFTDLTPVMMMAQVLDDRRNLERMVQYIVRGFAYPYGYYNDEVVKTLPLAGIAYARTVETTHTFAIPRDWMRIETTCHHGDPQLMELAHKFLQDTPEKEPYLFSLWGHSYEFEANDNWRLIDDFLKLMSGRQDIWYARNIEIYEYCKAFDGLVFSAEGNYVYNPSGIPVFGLYNQTLAVFPAGKCIAVG